MVAKTGTLVSICLLFRAFRTVLRKKNIRFLKLFRITDAQTHTTVKRFGYCRRVSKKTYGGN